VIGALVPIRFKRLGLGRVPTVDFLFRTAASEWVENSAFVDTGSTFTLVSADLLRSHGISLEDAKPLPGGVEHIGGTLETWFLESVVFALPGQDRRAHFTNLPRLHFTEATHIPILGRDVLRRYNAILTIDFNRETGGLTIG
jgi:hypothetical protein